MRISYAHPLSTRIGKVRMAPASRRRKRATNLSVDDRLLERANRLKLNLSQVFEAGLERAVHRRPAQVWAGRNRAALRARNGHIREQPRLSRALRPACWPRPQAPG